MRIDRYTCCSRVEKVREWGRTKQRSTAELRSTVIDEQTPFVPLVVPRVSGELTELEAKQVKIGNRRYIVCRNLAEARRDAEQRSAILDGLRAKLAQSLP